MEFIELTWNDNYQISFRSLDVIEAAEIEGTLGIDIVMSTCGIRILVVCDIVDFPFL